MKSEMKQCACTKCKKPQNEVLMYKYKNCNHVLHLIFTVLTYGLWAIVWLLLWNNSKKFNENNKNIALLSLKCDKCGGPLMLFN